MAPPSYFLMLLSTSLYTLLINSLPTLPAQPNTTLPSQAGEHLTYPIPFTTNYLDIFINRAKPLNRSACTNAIAQQVAAVERQLAYAVNTPLLHPISTAAQGCFLTSKAMKRDGSVYMLTDLRDTLIALQIALVWPGVIFETFWYLRNREGVAFANGMMAEEEPPPGSLGGLQLEGLGKE